jgi:uncharacterized damage-inducible protein DinB
MTSTTDILTDAFERVRDTALRTIDGLSEEQLASRPTPDSNSIAWLVWHLARVQDDHIADAAADEQRYTADGWHERFGLPFDAEATGYGFDSDDVGAVRNVSAELLAGYLTAVHDRTAAYLATLDDEDLARIVEEGWNPPVTLAVRLVSVISDDLQHAGQASYVKGLLT